jgi:hypothetical protein
VVIGGSVLSFNMDNFLHFLWIMFSFLKVDYLFLYCMWITLVCPFWISSFTACGVTFVCYYVVNVVLTILITLFFHFAG